MKLITPSWHLLSLVVLTVPHTVLLQQNGLTQSGVCPNHRLYDPISDLTYSIPDTQVGQRFTSRQLCMTNGRPYVALECLYNSAFGAQWGLFQPNGACNFSQLATSPATATLKRLCSMDLENATVASTALNRTLALSQDPGTLSALDVVYIADIIQITVERSSISAHSAAIIVEIIDNIISVDDSILQESRQAGNATNRLILSLERLGGKVSLDSDGNQSLRLVTDSMAVEVWNISHLIGEGGDLVIGLEQRVTGEVRSRVLKANDLFTLFENDDLDFNRTDVAIVLPADFLRHVTEENPGEEVRLSLGVFSDTSLFGSGSLESRMPKNRDDFYTLNSKVVSARVTVQGQPISDLAGYNVTTVFLPYNTSDTSERHVRHTRCVFWNFDGGEGLAAWSDEGCTSQDADHGRDVCLFDHLTNFAVLMDLYGQTEPPPEEHQTVLSLLTIIGLSLSISGLSITILAFIRISKLRQGKHQQVLFNLALAMLLSWVIFLAGFTRVENHVGCLVVAALLHYFILASFMWMLMEGVLQYLLFVKVLGANFSHYMTKTSLLAWGLPLLPVIIVLAIDPELYNGGEKYCWMSLPAFYYAFLLPMAMVMLTNIVIYIMVVVNICRRGGLAAKATAQSSAVHSQRQRAVGVRASLACFVVLGLSWVFAFFAVDEARVVFQYLFTITTSLQGLLIFLVFTARDANVRSAFKRLTRRSPSLSSTVSRGGRSSSTTSTISSPYTEMKSSRSTLCKK